MRIISLYIFREDGIPLLSRFYDISSQKVDGLVAPFLVSTTNRFEEITGSNLQEVRLTEDTHLVMEQFAGIIFAIIVKNKKDESIDLNIAIRKFYKRFHRSLSGKGWTGKLDKFDDFVPELEELLNIEPEVVFETIPTKHLDGFILADYPVSYHPLIKRFIKEDEISIEEINSMDISQEIIDRALYELAEQEYIGIKQHRDQGRIYFRLV